MDTTFLITAFATLFVVIDPPGLVPLFIALTTGMSPERRRAMATRACIIATILLTVFGLFGEAVLGFIGISMSAFRIAGGITAVPDRAGHAVRAPHQTARGSEIRPRP